MMFERLTDSARRVLVLAQEEARLLNHNFIGTGHILLGLLREGDGVAAQALGALAVLLEDARERVRNHIGSEDGVTTASPPFTPRARAVLALSLREALLLGHDYIGTEHVLLGLVREGEGVGARVLVSLGVDLSSVRQQVMEFLPGQPAQTVAGASSPADLSRPGVIYASGSSLRVYAAPMSVPGRRFPDELLTPDKPGEAPEGARVDLVCHDRQLIRGSVAGADVRLSGAFGTRGGPVRGSWAAETVDATWREGDGADVPGSRRPDIAGHFGGSTVELLANFEFGAGQLFERADISGSLGGQTLQAQVQRAAGGLDSLRTVVGEGILGGSPFEFFVTISWDSSSAMVRGSFDGQLMLLDADREERSGLVRVVGSWTGPAPLLALLVTSLLYFL